jgi:transcriptional regulator with XRE-family HTH domain
MEIGKRLKDLREAKGLSQGDIEKRSGLVRPYTSRVENGHTVPSLETLEKYARALEMPLYRIFYEGDEPPGKPLLAMEEKLWGSSGKERNELRTFVFLIGRMKKRDRRLLLRMAQKMATRGRLSPLARGAKQRSEQA